MTILDDVSKSIGLPVGEDAFNPDILMFSNIAIFDLYQNGVISTDSIKESTDWTELGYLGKGVSVQEILTPYIGMIVKIHFDSPAPSMVQTYNQTAARILERLAIDADSRRREVEQIEHDRLTTRRS